MKTQTIDRINPARRPSGRCRGYQNWRSLLFMHWPVAVETLRALVPSDLDLDFYEDRAYVGVVPFGMQGVRPAWCPKTLAFKFLETNVRTYVCYRGKPGVYFLSLEAASRLAVWTARTFWGLPYHYAQMSFTEEGDAFCYQSRRTSSGAIHKVRYRPGERLGSLNPDSLDYFVLERYILFAEHRGQLHAGQVHHTPYPAQHAEVLEVEDQLLEAAGLGGCSGLPVFAHYAAGVDVEVFDLKPV